MKRKIIALILAVLMLPTLALAQAYYTLPEVREQAKAGWHRTYTDKYGRETVVDIDIDVFGEDKAPVLRVGWHEEYDGDLNDPQKTLKNAMLKKGGNGYTTYASDYGEKIDLDKRYGEAYGMELTPREAYDIFRRILEAQGVSAENFLYEQPDEFEVRCSMSRKTEAVVAPARYLFHLWPTLYKLPIMGHINDGLYWGGTGPYCESSSIFRARSENEWAVLIHAFEEQERLAEDIPLCSVERVIESIEVQVRSGHIQEVRGLHLGFVMFNDPQIQTEKPTSCYDVESWYLVPTWLLECRYAQNPKNDYEDERRTIEGESPVSDVVMIHAQTGEVFKWMEGKVKGRGAGDARYKGFIPWDEIK